MVSPMLAMGAMSAMGAGKGGSTKVNQTLTNNNSSLVSFSTVTNVGGGGVTGTTAPGTSTQTATSAASSGTDDSSYTPALGGVFDSPTSVPDTTTTASTDLSGLPIGWIAAAVAALVGFMMFKGKF